MSGSKGEATMGLAARSFCQAVPVLLAIFCFPPVTAAQDPSQVFGTMFNIMKNLQDQERERTRPGGERLRRDPQVFERARSRRIGDTHRTGPRVDPFKLQEWLVWQGLYEGPLDGLIGPGSISAIKDFQRELGASPTGRLRPDQLRLLKEFARQRVAEMQFEVLVDDESGARIGLARGVFRRKRTVSGGADFVSKDGASLIALRHFPSYSSLNEVYSDLRGRLVNSGATIDNRVNRNGWFVISGEKGTRSFYIRNEMRAGNLATLTVVSPPSETLTSALKTSLLMSALTFKAFQQQPNPKRLSASPKKFGPLEPLKIIDSPRDVMSVAAVQHANINAQMQSDMTAASAEVTFWESVKGTDKPEEIEAYIDAFPDGTFVSLARLRLRRMKSDDRRRTRSFEHAKQSVKRSRVEGSNTARVALVIGNAAYRYAGDLLNPANDAADIADALERFGFQVVRGLNLDKMGMDRAIREFSRSLRGAKVGLFFYAGHGIQVTGKNYLVPVDAKLEDASGVDFELVPADLVQRTMERAGSTNLIFLDACRNNPLTRNLARAMGTRAINIGRGLAPIESGFGTLISFSTQPGNVALDGTGRNSPFSAALVNHIGTPGDSVSDTLIKVRREVMEATNKRQVPWEHSSLTGQVFFSQETDVQDRKPEIVKSKEVEIETTRISETQRISPKNEPTASRSNLPAETQCKGLAPTSAQNIKESFKGKIEGRLGGIVGKLTGGVAGLHGEYAKVTKDALMGYPESHKLYVWQRLIYLACVNGGAGIDINALAQAYLVGPSMIASAPAVSESKLAVELVGFDEISTDLISHYKFRGLRQMSLPNLVFSIANNSRDTVHMNITNCSFMNFKLLEPVVSETFNVVRNRARVGTARVNSLTGTAQFLSPGNSHTVVRPGQKKYVSYGIMSLEALSFEARRQRKTSCKFGYSSDKNAFYQEMEIEISSSPRLAIPN
ncbi:MAG: caspase family protein [Hyphomicrobiaceae bacterium]